MLKSGASYIAFAVSNKVGDAPGVGHDRQRGVGPVAVGNGPPSTTNKFATSGLGTTCSAPKFQDHCPSAWCRAGANSCR